MDKYFRDMFANLAQSDDPAVIEAKLEEVKPKTMMMFVQEFERRMKQLQDELNMKLEHLMAYHFSK